MTEGPPNPPQRAHEHREHGVTRSDPYAWLRELDSPEVLAHLRAEREWYDSATEHLRPLALELRTEMASRLPPTDRSVRWVMEHYTYYTVLAEGSDHPQLLRELNTDRTLEATESVRPGQFGDRSGGPELLLDVEALRPPGGYVETGVLDVSPDERLLAWSSDIVGDEVYRLHFRDLASGRDVDGVVPRSYYTGAWAAGSDAYYYVVHDDAYRPSQVWRHRIGTPVSQDDLVLEEPDQRFDLEVRASRSGRLVVLTSRSRDTSEVWVVDALRGDPPLSVGGRRRGVEYDAEHVLLPEGGDLLLLVTNDGAAEFRLAGAPVPRGTAQDHTAWRPLLDEDPEARLERADAFATHVVLSVRTRAQHRLRILPVGSVAAGTQAGMRELAPTPAGGTVAIGRNERYDARAVTVVEQSYVDPPVWQDVDLAGGERSERHRQDAPGHDRSAYVSEVRRLPSADGTPVPVTLVRHRDTPLDGTAPAVLYGYGAYEYTFEPEWDPALPSLLDRGVVYVHAHVRGGGEGGRRWWLEGRLEHKQNTFTDHASVADALAGEVVDPARIATRGLSAGGLLQGAVFGQRPDRWRAVVAEVPFVDVVTTMLDPTIPLTVNEWDEWGDPRRAPDFAWMLAYSPYDNLPAAGGRPDLLVTGAVHDARVMVWEPAKWVAALRASDPGWARRCLFRVEVGAGAHAGPSGRYARLDYEAEVYAWLLDALRT